MVEGFVNVCSRYIVDMKTIFDRAVRNLRKVHDELLARSYLFKSGGEPIGKVEVIELDDKSWAQAHLYVLLHHEAIKPLQT